MATGGSQVRKRPRATQERNVGLEKEFGNGELRRRLELCGIELDVAGGCYTVDSVQTLAQELGRGLDAPSDDAKLTATGMVEELENAWNDLECFKRALMPLQTKKPSSNFIFAKDTLVKVLLSISAVQPPLLCGLLQKIPEIPMLLDGDGGRAKTMDLVRLTVAQLRWLDHVVESEELGDVLVSVILACPEGIQKQIIPAIPEIVDDAQHSAAADTLITLLENSSELSAVILDSLDCLVLTADEARTACSSVMRLLHSADPELFPALVKFLVRNVPTPEIPNTLHALAGELAKPSLGVTAARMTLDALRESFRARPELVTFTLTRFKGSTREPLQPGDLWLLAVVHESVRNFGGICVRLLAGERISSEVVTAAFQPFKEALSDLNRMLLVLAASALQCSQPGARTIASQVYALSWEVFGQADSHREVIGSLLEFIGTRRPALVSGALAILVELCRQKDLSPFSPFLEGLLDFLESFQDDQVRLVFTLLALVRKQGPSEDNMLEMLIRKELSHTEVRFRRIGVIGACTVLTVLNEDERMLGKARTILNLLMSNVTRDSEIEVFAYTELAAICRCGTLRKRLAKSIAGAAGRAFETRFAVEGTNEPEDGAAELKFNLDGEDATISVPLTKLSRRDRLGDANVLCPLVRLLCDVTKLMSGGSLESIDAVLGCPMWLPSGDRLDDLGDRSDDEQAAGAIAMVLASQWIRCLIGCFAGQNGVMEMQRHAARRLAHLGEVETVLYGLIDEHEICRDAVARFLHVKNAKNVKKQLIQGLEVLKSDSLWMLELLGSEHKTAHIQPGEALLLLRDFKRLLEGHAGTVRGESPQGLCEAAAQLGHLWRLVRESGQIEDVTLRDCFAVSVSCLKLAFENENLTAEELSGLSGGFLKNAGKDRTSGGETPSPIAGLSRGVLKNAGNDRTSGGETPSPIAGLSGGDLKNAGKDRTSGGETPSSIAEDLAEMVSTAYKGAMQADKIDAELAVELISLLYAVASRLGANDMRRRVHSYAKELIWSGVWRALDSKRVEALMPGLLQIFVRSAEAPLESIELLIPDDSVKHARTHTRVAFAEFQVHLRDAKLDFDGARKSVGIYARLVERAREQEKLFGPLMRCGKQMAEALTNRILPLVEKKFGGSREDCLSLIGEYQGATRVLQHLCSHAKVAKRSALTTIVPSLKRAIEKVIFAVKRLLDTNGASSAFWMGNLKHRNMQGEVVASQVNYSQTESQRTEADDSPEDEVADPETADGDQAEGGSSQADEDQDPTVGTQSTDKMAAAETVGQAEEHGGDVTETEDSPTTYLKLG